MKTEIGTNNPAERLHKIIVTARSTPGSHDWAPLIIWAPVFRVNATRGDHESMIEAVPAMVRHLTTLGKLVDDVQEGLEHESVFDPILLEALPPIRRIIAVSLANLIMPSTNLMQGIDERRLAFLEMAARQWYRLPPEPRVDEKELEVVLKETRELFVVVNQSPNIAPELKKLILSMLVAIDQAIQQYRIRGPVALEEGLTYVLASLHLKQDVVEEVKKHQDSEAWNWFSKATSIGAKVFSLMTFAEKNRPALTAASKFIHLLVSGDPKIPPVDLPGK